tara:strand:+ start:13 stop:351 length:339 start_codon:yes stop_codon:yes gene_type:complete
MKKLCNFIFLGLIWANYGFAEKYVCSYLYNQKPESIVFERSGNYFIKSNKTKNKIVFEDQHAIVLTNTFTDMDDYEPTTFSTIINKKKLNFVFVGLSYRSSTAIVEGECDAF